MCVYEEVSFTELRIDFKRLNFKLKWIWVLCGKNSPETKNGDEEINYETFKYSMSDQNIEKNF